MAYCSTPELKRYLGITGSGDDELLSELLASAQQIIETHTGKKFEASSDTTRYFDAVADVDGYKLFFDQWCADITSITNGDGESVSGSSYVTMPVNGEQYYGVKLLGSKSVTWTYTDDAESAISVTGKWAYMVTPKDDIVQATKRLAAFLYRQRENANDVDRAVVVGNATVLPSQLPADVSRLIAPYRSLTSWT